MNKNRYVILIFMNGKFVTRVYDERFLIINFSFTFARDKIIRKHSCLFCYSFYTYFEFTLHHFML